MVQLPDGEKIKATQQGELNISNKLNRETQHVTILPQLKSSSLISLGKLCDDDCQVILNKNDMIITKEGDQVLNKYRNKVDGL